MAKKKEQQIEPLRKPYPKCVGSIENDVVAIHATEGGVIPTPTLQDFTGRKAELSDG